jgi:hypothetical protein
MNIRQDLSDHMFSYLVFLCMFGTIVFSFYRFFVRNDYMVWYHGTCDPSVSSCFKDCEGDTCVKENYYTKVEKYAPDLLKQCGKDIKGCSLANMCTTVDSNCKITFCSDSLGQGVCSSLVQMNGNEVQKDLTHDAIKSISNQKDEKSNSNI